MKNSIRHLIAFLGLFCSVTLSFGQVPNLRSTSGFSLFTAVGAFTNDGSSIVFGNVGTNAGAYTGDSLAVIGNVHVANSVSAQAALDVDTVYQYLVGLTSDSTLPYTTALGNNRVLLSGVVYALTGATNISGHLILDGQNNPSAIFIIKIDGALSSATKSIIMLQNQAAACNVFWQVNGAVSLGVKSEFVGTIVANGAISLLDSAIMNGRGLSTAGAINLKNNLVVGFDGFGNPLPVTLLDFKANQVGSTVELHWSTATEINNDYFTLERTQDAIQFEEFISIGGAGNSLTVQQYTAVDNQPYNGLSYYRLTQTDYDGTVKYSGLIKINLSKPLTVGIYPNPMGQLTTISLSAVPSNSKIELKIFNSLGEEAAHYFLLEKVTQFETGNLKPGFYIYQVLNNYELIETGKLVSAN